jgi:chaperonin GroEL
MSGLETRISFLENILSSEMVGDSQRDEITEQISKLKGGLIMIHPGGRTEFEASECRDRITDAVCAVQIALKSGFVSGGGSALIHASKVLSKLGASDMNADWKFGVKVALEACKAPCK